MKMHKLLLFFLLTSCSFFIEKIDAPLVQTDDRYYERVPQVETFCPIGPRYNFQLVGTVADSQNAYYEMIHRLGAKNFDYIDHFALWSLLQLSIRPDQSSSSSRFQVLIHEKTGKGQYFDFFSEVSEEQYPFFYGIEWILKKYGKKKNLEHYARILQQSLNQKLKVGKEFASFLNQNQEAIKENPLLSSMYFRGTEILKEDESFPDVNFAELLRLYRKASHLQKIIVNTTLTPFVTQTGDKGSCNYDFNLYDNSIFLIDKIIPVANLFGYADKDSAFQASSSQKINVVASLHGTPLFKGDSKVRSSAVCYIEGEDKRIWTFANQSRDPGQHLFHLVRYGLPRSASTQDVDKLIRHSRHLFLSDPVRLVIESHRSRPDQIENLLKLNLPIYNAEYLGNIWAYTYFKGENRFIIDDRNPGSFLCK